MKLLIVDDSLIMRRAVERAVSGNPRFTEVRFAVNGRAALDEFARFQPDFVTMDITMPEMDGIMAVEAIKSRNRSARILIVSALADRETAIEAIKKGAQGFLLKPVTADSLIEAIDDIMSP